MAHSFPGTILKIRPHSCATPAQHAAEVLFLCPVERRSQQHVIDRHDDCKYCIQAVSLSALSTEAICPEVLTCCQEHDLQFLLHTRQPCIYISTASFARRRCKEACSQRPVVWPNAGSCKRACLQTPVSLPCVGSWARDHGDAGIRAEGAGREC